MNPSQTQSFHPKQVKPSREKANHSQMNIRGVFLHVLGDALGSIVVIVSALVVWLSDWDHKEVSSGSVLLSSVVKISYFRYIKLFVKLKTIFKLRYIVVVCFLFQYVDPSLSIVIVIIIVSSTIPLLKESSLVLMQTVPDNYEVSELKENLLIAVPEILDIHEVNFGTNVFILAVGNSQLVMAATMNLNSAIESFFFMYARVSFSGLMLRPSV
jgi:zinc transporter 1